MVLFTVNRFDFHPVFTCLSCCAAARCCPRRFFSIGPGSLLQRGFPPEEDGEPGRRRAHETSLLFGSITVPIDVLSYSFNRRGGSFLCERCCSILLVLWFSVWHSEREQDEASQDIYFLHFDSCRAAWRKNKSWNQLYLHTPSVICEFYLSGFYRNWSQFLS